MPPSAPPELERLQRGLRDVFTDPRGARAAAAARPEALSWIRDGRPCGAAERLSVYGDGYFLRLLEALSFDFKAVLSAAGEKSFRILAAGYIAAHPSTSPSLADLGAKFPEFLAGHSIAQSLPFLSDLARLELCAVQCLLNDRLPPLPPEAFSRISAEDWSEIRLILDPTTRLLKTSWPVAGLWKRRDGALGRLPKRPKEQRLLVARDERWAVARELDAPEWETLSRLMAGAALGEALTGINQAALDVSRWFSGWVEAGLIKGVQPK